MRIQFTFYKMLFLKVMMSLCGHDKIKYEATELMVVNWSDVNRCGEVIWMCVEL